MSEPSTSTSVSTADIPAATESANKVLPPRAKGRKGKPAAARDAERFRFKKNQDFDKSRQSALKARFGTSSSATVMFGDALLSSVDHPSVKFSISTMYILDICRAYLETLRHACKVHITDQDLPTLVLATVIQTESKVWFSHQHSKFHLQSGPVESRARRAKAVLADALFPISYYIEQIGYVVVEGQKQYPEIVDLTYDALLEQVGLIGLQVRPPGTLVLPKGNVLTGMQMWANVRNQALGVERGIFVVEGDIVAFSPDFIEHPENFEWLGVFTLTTPVDVLPTFDETVNTYRGLVDRVSRRVNNCTVPIDFADAKGTTAQLVTSVPSSDHTTQVDVWSNERIDNDSRMIGALLRFGYNLAERDDAHSYDYRKVEAHVETAGALQRFVGNVTQRLIR